MSADNGIFIGRFVNKTGEYEYRVVHTNASYIDDYTLLESDQERHSFIKQCWAGTTPYTDTESAYQEAAKLYDECMIVEYGICPIYYDILFPV